MASLKELYRLGPTEKLEIGTRSELPKAIESLRSHLEKYPQDGSLFLVDPIKAFTILGVQFSPDVREHIQHALKGYKLTAPDTGNVFDRAIQGELSPFELGLQLTPPGSRLRAAKVYNDIESHPLSQKAFEEGRHAFQNSLANFRTEKALVGVPLPVSDAQGYDVAIQISQEAINDIIREAYDHGGLNKVWRGDDKIDWLEFGIRVKAAYAIQLDQPKLELGVPSADSVALTIGARAKLKLEVDIDDIPADGDQSYEFDEEFELGFSITVQSRVIIGPGSRSGLVAAYIDLVNIVELKLEINQHEVPEGIVEALRMLLEAVCRSKLAEQNGIPLSMDIEEAARAGVPIYPPESKILPPTADHPAALSILIDVKGTTPGDRSALAHFIPPGQDFAMIVSSELIYRGWNEAKRTKFPIYEGDLKLDNPDFRLLDGRMYSKVEAHYTLIDNCLGSWTIDAVARLWTSLEAFQKDSIWYVRPKEVDVDIDMDDWDRFVFETILGAILALLGVGGPIARSIISKIIFELIIGLAEKYAAEAVGGYSVGVYGKIPKTNRKVISSTPVLPNIKPDGITAFGNLEFRNA